MPSFTPLSSPPSYGISCLLSSTYRLPSPEWNVLLNNRTPNGESRHQPSINNTSPRFSWGLRIYIRYASPWRSYVRAIEKTVSSLIPPTATFRLPAAWQRIGSADWEEMEKAKVIDEERRCGGREKKLWTIICDIHPVTHPSRTCTTAIWDPAIREMGFIRFIPTYCTNEGAGSL